MNERGESDAHSEAPSVASETDSSDRSDLLATFAKKDGETLESSDRQAVPSEMFTQEQSERLRSIEVLQEERWRESDRSTREDALIDLETELAKTQGRPTVDVHFEQMAAGEYGYYDGDIHIRSSDVDEPAPSEAVNTVAHEGRHAYQDYCMDTPGHHSDAEQVQQWIENSENYLRPGDLSNGNIVTEEMYKNQPLEADAWPYGDEVARVMAAAKSGEGEA